MAVSLVGRVTMSDDLSKMIRASLKGSISRARQGIYWNRISDAETEVLEHTAELAQEFERSHSEAFFIAGALDARLSSIDSAVRRRLMYAIASLLIAAYAFTANLTGDIENRRIGVLTPGNSQKYLQLEQRAVMLVALIYSATIAILYISVRNSNLLKKREIRANSDDQTRSLIESIRYATDGVVTQITNERLGPLGILQFPTKAPRLVELDTRQIVSSSTQAYLTEFLNNHDSSTIGLSGPRGSGKSTIMNYLDVNMRGVSGSVYLTAPVRYDSGEFARRLLTSIAETLLVGKTELLDPAYEQWLRARRVAVVRAVFSATLSMIGFIILLLQFLSPEAVRIRLGLATIFAVTLLLVGLALLLYALLMSPRALPFLDLSPSQALAAKLLQQLRYTSEVSQSSKNILSLFGDMFGSEDEDVLKLAAKERSLMDIVADIRVLLSRIAEERKGSVFLILIDELDKLSRTEDLIDAINSLKDLFHIAGVHFVISVSSEALAAFEQRGIPARDAFDSSFDTVMDVAPLSYSESYDVISSRAEGFPPLAALFCHAWAGGLPRELVRVARSCVEVQRETNSALTLAEIVGSVVLQDTRSTVESLLHAPSSDEPDGLLWEIYISLNEMAPDSLILPNIEAIRSAPDNLRALSQTVFLGIALTEFIARRLATASAWGSTSRELLRSAEEVARAIRSRGYPHKLRDYEFEKAVRSLSVSGVTTSSEN
jgi:energy-coupling factor transporter ATP-binding protein EcfA2